MALEQTVNADAASQRTGIASMTNSISAYQRWAKFPVLRTIVISYLYEDLNLTKKEDITESLEASNINKDNLAVKEIKSMIENSLTLTHLRKMQIQIVFSIYAQRNHVRKVLKISF